MTITQDELEHAGCKKIAWNDGAFTEWYLPVKGDGRSIRSARLSVRYDEWPGTVRTWLILPGLMVYLQHVTTIEDYLTMYRLLTGKNRRIRKVKP